MPILSTSLRPIPPATQRAARDSFGSHTFYILVGNQLAAWLQENDQQNLVEDRDGWNLNGLSVITIFQYLESLHDQQAVEAARTRVDWKYALHLPLNFPGFAARRLCRERYRIREQMPSVERFQNMIVSLAQIYQPGRSLEQIPEVRGVLQQVCTNSRLQVMLEAIRMVFEILASQHPQWLREISLPHWYERYRPGATWDQQLRSSDPVTCAELLGADICYVLERINLQGLPGMLALDEVQHLQRSFAQQYHTGNGTFRWRRGRCANCQDGGLYQQ